MHWLYTSNDTAHFLFTEISESDLNALAREEARENGEIDLNMLAREVAPRHPDSCENPSANMPGRTVVLIP